MDNVKSRIRKRLDAMRFTGFAFVAAETALMIAEEEYDDALCFGYISSI